MAKKLRFDLELTTKPQPTRGPLYWITENGELLLNLNDKVRKMEKLAAQAYEEHNKSNVTIEEKKVAIKKDEREGRKIIIADDPEKRKAEEKKRLINIEREHKARRER